MLRKTESDPREEFARLQAEYIKVSEELLRTLYSLLPSLGPESREKVLRLHLRCTQIVQSLIETQAKHMLPRRKSDEPNVH